MSVNLLNSSETKACDLNTIKKGTSSSILVSRAGKKVTEEILKRTKPCKTLVVCSSKGNGADGAVVARLLREHGYDVSIFILSKNFNQVAKEKFSMFTGDLLENYPVNKEFSLIIDAMIGTGLINELNDKYKEVVSQINKSSAYTVSIDIASGISSDTGLSLGLNVLSDLTVAISEYKVGHFLADGPDSYHELVLVKIGIENTIKNPVKKYNVTDFYGMLKKRKSNVNKGTFKRSTIIAGSLKASGASMLSYLALSSLLVGTGYSSLATKKSLAKRALFVNPEVMLVPLKESFSGKLKFSKKEINEIISKSQSIAIGMGLEESKNTYKIIKYLLKNYTGRLLIDASGLNVLSTYGIDILLDKKCEVILTPHIKEFSRLLNSSVKEVLESRISLGSAFAKKYDVTLLLKSNTTLVFYKDEVALTNEGNSALAKGGSGDTLSGIVAGLLTKDNLSVYQAGILGSIILGMASDEALKNNNVLSLLPNQVVKCVSNVISVIINKSY